MSKSKLKIGLMGLAAKPIPPTSGNICAPNEIVYRIALGLTKVGHEVVVFTGKDSASELNKVSAGLKSTWHQYGTDTELDAATFKKKKEEYENILANEAVKYFKDGKIDLIHSHDFRISPPIFAAHNVFTLYTVHGDLTGNPLANDSNHLNILRNKNFGFLNISSDNVNFCIKNKLRSVALTPNGIDTDKFGFSNKKRTGILVVARMIGVKKIKEVIDIAFELKEQITLIGPEGPSEEDKAYFADLKANYFTKSNVFYVGYLPQDKIIPYYQKARVMLFISESEGMPLSILEAQSTGLPVVANKVGGVKDIIIDNKTGCFIDDIGNIDEIKQKIIKAGKIKPAECRENIVMNYSYEKMVKNYIQAYNKFLRSCNG